MENYTELSIIVYFIGCLIWKLFFKFVGYANFESCLVLVYLPPPLLDSLIGISILWLFYGIKENLQKFWLNIGKKKIIVTPKYIGDNRKKNKVHVFMR